MTYDEWLAGLKPGDEVLVNGWHVVTVKRWTENGWLRLSNQKLVDDHGYIQASGMPGRVAAERIQPTIQNAPSLARRTAMMTLDRLINGSLLNNNPIGKVSLSQLNYIIAILEGRVAVPELSQAEAVTKPVPGS